VDKLRWLLSLTSIYFDIDTIYRLGMNFSLSIYLISICKVFDKIK